MFFVRHRCTLTFTLFTRALHLSWKFLNQYVGKYVDIFRSFHLSSDVLWVIGVSTLIVISSSPWLHAWTADSLSVCTYVLSCLFHYPFIHFRPAWDVFWMNISQTGLRTVSLGPIIHRLYLTDPCIASDDSENLINNFERLLMHPTGNRIRLVQISEQTDVQLWSTSHV